MTQRISTVYCFDDKNAVIVNVEMAMDDVDDWQQRRFVSVE